MKNLFTALKQLLGNTSDEYRLIRGKFFRVIGLIFAASLLAVALNFWGFKTANAMIGCILPFVALYIFTSPKVIGGVFLAGIVTSPRHPVTGIKGITELVGQALAWIVLVTSLFFLVVGTLPFGRNFGAVWVIYLCFGILLLMDVRNIKKTKFAMGLLYAYVVVALVLSLGSMIPGPVHIKVYGHDLFSWLRVSPVEEAIARVENAETKVEEKIIAVALAVIEKKILQGQPLTTNEQSIKVYAKALRDENTTPAKAKGAWRNVFPDKTNTANVPVTVSTFTINKDEVISTLHVPDNSTVYIEADKAFCLLEGYGKNDDGSQKSSKLTMPPGKSKKYFAGGGTLRVIGLFDNTTVKLHL